MYLTQSNVIRGLSKQEYSILRELCAYAKNLRFLRPALDRHIYPVLRCTKNANGVYFLLLTFLDSRGIIFAISPCGKINLYTLSDCGAINPLFP